MVTKNLMGHGLAITLAVFNFVRNSKGEEFKGEGQKNYDEEEEGKIVPHRCVTLHS